MKEQQIQRYEATRYAGVTLERLQAVADALGVVIHEHVVLPTSTQPPEDKSAPSAADERPRRHPA